MPRLIQPDSNGNCCDRCEFPDPCADCGIGACCLPDEAGCINTTEADCNEQEGEYQGDGTDCVDNPCGACPPAEAPTHMSVRANLTGVASSDEICGAVDIDFAFDHTTERDLDGLWVGDEVSCSVDINETDFAILYSCPEDCPEDSLHIPLWGANLAIESGTWKLRPYFEVGQLPFCGGSQPLLSVSYPDVEIDLGTNPIGTHVVTIDDPTIDNATLVITVIIS